MFLFASTYKRNAIVEQELHRHRPIIMKIRSPVKFNNMTFLQKHHPLSPMPSSVLAVGLPELMDPPLTPQKQCHNNKDNHTH